MATECIHGQHENHFYCVREHQSFGENIASVANWVSQNFSKIVLLHKPFLKKAILLFLVDYSTVWRTLHK